MAKSPNPNVPNPLGKLPKQMNNSSGINLYGRRGTNSGLEPLGAPPPMKNPISSPIGGPQPAAPGPDQTSIMGDTQAAQDISKSPIWKMTQDQWKKAKLKAGVNE